MIGLLSPFIALLINKSLITGCFPAEFKEAIVHPLLKRDGPEEPQACFKLAIPLEVIGEGGSSSSSGTPEREQSSSWLAVCVSSIAQHRNRGYEGV